MIQKYIHTGENLLMVLKHFYYSLFCIRWQMMELFQNGL